MWRRGGGKERGRPTTLLLHSAAWGVGLPCELVFGVQGVVAGGDGGLILWTSGTGGGD